MKKLLTVLGIVLLTLSFSACFSSGEKIDWKYIQLGSVIPEPNSNKADIRTNANDELDIEIYKVSENDFQEYVYNCENTYGFTIDTDTYTNHFSSFNNDGYELSLSYYESSKKMHIQLYAPVPTVEYELPDFALEAGLPVPESKIGYWKHEQSEYFYLFVCETSIEDYREYRDLCIGAGFSIDTYEGELFYSADNEEGYHLSIGYEGYNRIKIEMHCPDENEIDSETENIDSENISEEENGSIDELSECEVNTSNEDITNEVIENISENNSESNIQENNNTNEELIDGMRKEFKESMDDYEAFFDEYVTFMQKYNESSDVASMLLDYTELMNKYDKYVKSFEEWEDKDMNDAELACYIEVQNRVNQKLLSLY